jgi:hypothetical protein
MSKIRRPKKKKLDAYRKQIVQWVSLGKDPADIRRLIKANFKEEVSQPTVRNYINSLNYDMKMAKKLGEENKKLIKTEDQRKTLHRLDKVLDKVTPIVERLLDQYEVMDDVELFKNTDLHQLLGDIWKAQELRGKLTGEVSSGNKIQINIGAGDSNDRLFLEYVKYRVEREMGITMAQFFEEYDRWKKSKGLGSQLDIIDV